MAVPQEYLGVWSRKLITTTSGFRDDTTQVRGLETLRHRSITSHWLQSEAVGVPALTESKFVQALYVSCLRQQYSPCKCICFLSQQLDRKLMLLQVYWLQTNSIFVDSRVPVPAPVKGLKTVQDCSAEECLALAQQQGFAGTAVVHDGKCTWHRELDYQPAGGPPDIGKMTFKGPERVWSAAY